LFERVLEHEVDVGIAGRPPEDARIRGRAFLDNEIALIAAPAPPLTEAGPGSGTRQLPRGFLSAPELRPRTLSLGSNGAIKEAVRLGLGISLQSRVSVEHELSSGALAEVTLRGGLAQRQWYALHSATVPPRPAVVQF